MKTQRALFWSLLAFAVLLVAVISLTSCVSFDRMAEEAKGRRAVDAWNKANPIGTTVMLAEPLSSRELVRIFDMVTTTNARYAGRAYGPLVGVSGGGVSGDAELMMEWDTVTMIEPSSSDYDNDALQEAFRLWNEYGRRYLGWHSTGEKVHAVMRDGKKFYLTDHEYRQGTQSNDR